MSWREKVAGTLVFVGLMILLGLFLLGFFLFVVILIVVGLIVFIGFYIYIRLKLWWVKRHPPRELEGPEDYF